VAIVAPSLRYVGGQSVQADLLLRHWQGDPDVHASFIPVDPQFPAGLRWVARVPGLRTLVRTPFYLATLWHGLRDVDVAHIFSASHASFLIAVFPAWLVARMRGKKTLINYHSGEARDHFRRSSVAQAVLRRADQSAPSAFLVDVFLEFDLAAEAIPNNADFSQFTYRHRTPLRPHLVCTRGFHVLQHRCRRQSIAQVQKNFPAHNWIWSAAATRIQHPAAGFLTRSSPV
jgi:hypothetical protein